MQERQRPNPLDSLFQPARGQPDPAGGDRLGEARMRLAELSAAADRVLDRLDLGDSQAFLEQVRQSGGE